MWSDGFSYVSTVWTNGFKRIVLNYFPVKQNMFIIPIKEVFLQNQTSNWMGLISKWQMSAQCLGLMFHRLLTFRIHVRCLKSGLLTFRASVKYLKSVYDKALKVLKVVGHTDWGADKVILLRLYHALVHSMLNYGCVVYGSATRLVLRPLDAVHHAGLHICLGDFSYFHVQSLYIKAGEPVCLSNVWDLQWLVY